MVKKFNNNYFAKTLQNMKNSKSYHMSSVFLCVNLNNTKFFGFLTLRSTQFG